MSSFGNTSMYMHSQAGAWEREKDDKGAINNEKENTRNRWSGICGESFV